MADRFTHSSFALHWGTATLRQVLEGQACEKGIWTESELLRPGNELIGWLAVRLGWQGCEAYPFLSISKEPTLSRE